jgi:hypothetical protein
MIFKNLYIYFHVPARSLANFFLLTAMLSTGTAWGQTEIDELSDIDNADGHYVITQNISGGTAGVTTFNGTLEAAIDPTTHMPYRISGLTAPLFETLTGTVRNLVLDNVNISGHTGNTGAIACTANGSARIYNVGILSGSVGGSGNVGGLVGLLDGTARVVNCYSYANITSGGSTSNPKKYVGGLVGNNSQSSNQDDIKTVVVNCMFYGEINTTNCSNYAPVYGNNAIKNDVTKKVNNVDVGNGINPYCYFLGTAAFQTQYTKIDNYNRTWPADEEYLTRFEYYRSILNSNRQLMAWWATGDQTDTAAIFKWVLDPSVARYPILKKWGKYPSIINPDPTRTWDPEADGGNGAWQARSSANPYRGKSFGTLTVTVNAGSHHAGAGATTKTLPLTITDMDTLNHDYCYYKVQLPYYNEQFGNPASNNHDTRYGGNYKDYVVTGWKVTSMNHTGTHPFVADWENGYNFADRYCTGKDLYDTSGRVFAQGGFFYVPEGVTSITIEAYWGKAIYLHNTGHYLDRVNITNQSANGNVKLGDPFVPTGLDALSFTFQGQTVWDDWQTAVTKLDQATGDPLNKTVYDQAIVLLSNYQIRNENGNVGLINNKWYPYTLMSIDEDLDNEPDYCFEFQFRREFGRPGIQPIRFDFLPVPELGLAVRHGKDQNTIGIFIPKGHFEITETSFMHTTQFEYDGGKANKIGKGAPVILNGGHFEQIVVRYASANSDNGDVNRTNYFIMGGHFRMQRFTPGAHTNTKTKSYVRLCAVNAIGGEYPEFYLSGIYRPDIVPNANQGNPHCYTNGGRFDMMAGAGYDKINGNVTFKIDHSLIKEFYGGGINGANPVGGDIDVTIDHSLVGKYCGGPKVGVMADGKTVTTHATGTTFGRYYGGGNGGTSYYREQKQDGNTNMPSLVNWPNSFGYNIFNPLNDQLSNNKHYEVNRGYNALFEFECFVESNGIGGTPTLRTYINWAQFGTTSTGDITNVLTDCTIKGNFYGGGNLGNVDGDITSTLNNTEVKGYVCGGGFSGTIEPFRIHDRTLTEFPYIDFAGIMHNGALYYKKNANSTDRYYTWCYKNPTNGKVFPEGVVIPNGVTTNNPTFEYPENSNNWYVLTTVSLEDLGTVSGDVTLTIGGTSTVGTSNGGLLTGTGNVYGGGDESEVHGNTTVILQGDAHVLGNVFGGGNKGTVTGATTVTIGSGE